MTSGPVHLIETAEIVEYFTTRIHRTSDAVAFTKLGKRLWPHGAFQVGM
jgi:hypothetical protein